MTVYDLQKDTLNCVNIIKYIYQSLWLQYQLLIIIYEIISGFLIERNFFIYVYSIYL